MRRQLSAFELKLSSTDRELQAVSPQAVLNRGYSITTQKKGGQVIRSAAEVQTGQRLITRFADGKVESTVEDRQQMSLFD